MIVSTNTMIDTLRKANKSIMLASETMSREDINESTLHIFRIIACVDLLERKMIDYKSFLQSKGNYKYDRKQTIEEILKRCKRLSQLNDAEISFDKAEQFGEVLDTIEEGFNMIFDKSVLI